VRDEAAISSKALDGNEVSRGLSLCLQTLPGARAVRVIERPASTIDEHAHDWPVLSLYVMGSCTRLFQKESAAISGPCAVLHPPGEFHSSSVGATGLEQIDLEFDPAWLRLADADVLRRVRYWRGGRIGDAARRLAGLWASSASRDGDLKRATSEFIAFAMASKARREPDWLRTVLEKIDGGAMPSSLELAKAIDRHPAWLTQAYRAATGEGLQKTLMRKRVERAALLLRTGSDPAAEIAVEAGFCDQSHMIRCFHLLLGRTPNEVRAEGIAPAEASPGKVPA
jgi:AraC family transcriptional regulator